MDILKAGTPVVQIVKPITGTVRESRINQERGEVEYHVDYCDATHNDEPAARWFLASELTALPTKQRKATTKGEQA